MGIAKGLQSVAKLVQDLRLGTNDDAEEVLREEALRREREAVLLLKQFLAEVDVVGNVCELLRVDAYHHVHGCRRVDWFNALDARESKECSVSRCFEFQLKFCEE